MANEIVKETLHPDNSDNIDIYPKTSYDQVEGRPNLENGIGTGSLVQKYVVDETDYSAQATGDNSVALNGKRYDKLTDTNRTPTSAEGKQSFAQGGSSHAYGDWSATFGKDTKAYQKGSVAFGGGTQAGMTEEEFNTYFWDSTKNVALNNGKGKDSQGNILDASGRKYSDSYSLSFACGDSAKALGRTSTARGQDTKAIGIASNAEGSLTIARGYGAHAEGGNTEASHSYSHSDGYRTRTSSDNQYVGGQFNKDNKNALFIVGNGETEATRKNAIEVLKDGRAKVQSKPIEDDDVVRKVDLSGLSGKIYKHKISISSNTNDLNMIIYALLSNNTAINTLSLFKNKEIYLNGSNVVYRGQGSDKAVNVLLDSVGSTGSTYYVDIITSNGHILVDISNCSINDIVIAI